jgi:hypothetical protein
MSEGPNFIHPQDLAHFFAGHKNADLQNLSIFFGRADGVLLFTQNKHLLNEQESAMGVLLASAWQASAAMAAFFPGTAEKEFRYSYATSNQGIYLLPFPWQGEAYFMAAVYQAQDNPGAVKLLLRTTAQKLREFLDSLDMIADATRDVKAKPKAKAPSPKAAARSAEKRLFSNISDEEINQLFSFAENP